MSAPFDLAPAVAAPLEPGFRPLYLALREQARRAASYGSRVTFALTRGGGAVSHFSMPLLPEAHELEADSLRVAERILKFLLWQRGAYRVSIAGLRRP